MSKSKNTSEQAAAAHSLDVYGPSQANDKDIVDVLCSIMDDDGPRPMRDMRPSQKQRNAAEHFDSEHQGAYEARGRNSREANAVSLHNSGYPKMHDELARRRSTAKVSAITAQRNATIQQKAYSKCNNYIKKKKVEPKRKSSAPKWREHKRKSRSRQSTRITKTRRKRSTCRIYRLAKLRTNKACQCSTFFTAKDKKSGTTDGFNVNIQLADKMAVDEGSLPYCNLNRNSSDNLKPASNASQSSKVASNQNPDSDPSVSSYNSYASLEHEPMVSN